MLSGKKRGGEAAMKLGSVYQPGIRRFIAEGRQPCIWPDVPQRKYRNRRPLPLGYVPGQPQQLTPSGKRVKYNKGDLTSTMNAAIKTVGPRPWYVFATYSGYTISSSMPPYGQAYIKVNPDKTTEVVKSKFGPLSGEISTCAFWLPTEDGADYYCGGYAPTCESQSPGVCKIPPPDQYKFCAVTKKVKSDPKGRYRGKLITRCKTYSSRCMPEAACVSNREFPKPGTYKPNQKEVRDLAYQMAKEHNRLQEEAGPVLAREIMERGGLKAHRGESKSEEWANVPLHLKRKSGMTMDEMASEMGMDEAALAREIDRTYRKGTKTERRKTWHDFEQDAEAILMQERERILEPVPF